MGQYLSAVFTLTDTNIMSGFDDDFGEMVGGKESVVVVDDGQDDPAAEFLAREQEQLGDLETELGPLSVSPHKSPVAVVEKKTQREVCYENIFFPFA